MEDILKTHPSRETFDQAKLRAAIDALLTCASTCATCADACLHSGHADHMVRCIAMDNQCAAICFATANILSRPGPAGDAWREVVKACAAMCRECADECASHADMDHCQICAEACRACADACEALLAAAS